MTLCISNGEKKKEGQIQFIPIQVPKLTSKLSPMPFIFSVSKCMWSEGRGR